MRVADRGVGELLHPDVDDDIGLDPGVDRPDQCFAHPGEIEPIEVIEVDRVVVIDVAKRFVDEDRIGAIAAVLSALKSTV